MGALGVVMATINREERLQVMLTEEELAAVDDWRFLRRMPSRAAAIRELLKRGLKADGYILANKRTISKEYGLLVKQTSRTRDGGEGQ